VVGSPSARPIQRAVNPASARPVKSPLAKLAGLTVVATASRPETEAWVRELGADHVINHREDMVEQTRALGLQHVDHIAIFNDMRHWPAATELIRPQGGIVSIDETDFEMSMDALKVKSASLHWEFMFTRSMFTTPDMIAQHHLLNWASEAIDAGRLRTTVGDILSPINAATMREAHRQIETETTRGKLVIEGWPD
ncbi:MAG: zinc-binding dehydrogenase, partial [Pseudomonadota bacterium]